MKEVFIWFFGVVLLPVLGSAQDGSRHFIEVRDMETDSLIMTAQVYDVMEVHRLSELYGSDAYIIETIRDNRKQNTTATKRRPGYVIPSIKEASLFSN